MKEVLNIIKVGGKVLEDSASLDLLLDAFCGIEGRRMLVTGGGRTATAVASELGIKTRMIDGRRVTDGQMLKVVTMVYAGLVGKDVVARMQARGVNAIGLSGADMDVVRCEKRSPEPVDYGFAGDVRKVNAEALRTLIEAGAVPVLCPVTHDGKGQLLNTNADTMASAAATALAGFYDVNLIFCFEKKGVLSDPDDEDSVIETIDRETFRKLKADGTVSEGMIPKLENAFKAVDAGVGKVIITNAESLSKGCGTTIK
ncbi:MAG: acetylglutamate kinase [Bacteroidales bacterium]|nr:acetylglutamate kinase [Bacteroidales bacterium]